MLEILTISQFFQFSGDKTNQTKPRSSFGISAIFLCVLGVKSTSGFTWVCVYQNLSSDKELRIYVYLESRKAARRRYLVFISCQLQTLLNFISTVLTTFQPYCQLFSIIFNPFNFQSVLPELINLGWILGIVDPVFLVLMKTRYLLLAAFLLSRYT